MVRDHTRTVIIRRSYELGISSQRHFWVPKRTDPQKIQPLVDQANEFSTRFESLSDTELRAKTDEFKSRLAQGQKLDDLLPEAFAVCREASRRTIGLRHYDCQLV